METRGILFGNNSRGLLFFQMAQDFANSKGEIFRTRETIGTRQQCNLVRILCILWWRTIRTVTSLHVHTDTGLLWFLVNYPGIVVQSCLKSCKVIECMCVSMESLESLFSVATADFGLLKFEPDVLYLCMFSCG